MPVPSPETRSRTVAAVGAVALQVLIGWALITGLSVRIGHIVDEQMAVFDVAPPPPPPAPKPPPEHHATRRPAHAAAPPHARATPVPVVAPPPVVVLPPLPPVITVAPVAAAGPDPAAGAALAGTGTGAGGAGNGLGGGGGGVRARFLRGRIKDSDYPESARRAGRGGDVTTRYLIDTHGRIERCTVVSSSGNPDLDAATCRLAIERFRYAPARDERGHPVEDTVFEDHRWVAVQDRDDGEPPGN